MATTIATAETPKTKAELIKFYSNRLLLKIDQEAQKYATKEDAESQMKTAVWKNLKEQLGLLFSDEKLVVGFIVQVLIPMLKEKEVTDKDGKKKTEKYLDYTQMIKNQEKAIDDKIAEVIKAKPELQAHLMDRKLIKEAREEFTFINRYFEAIALVYLM